MTAIQDPDLMPAETPVAGARGTAGFDWLRRFLRAALPPAVVFVAFIALWETASRTGLLNKYIAPAPSVIFRETVSMAGQSFFWTAIRITLTETVSGFALGVGGGFVFGMLIALSPMIRRSLYPHAIALQIIPRSALAPLFLLWFGFGMTSKVILAASIAFFPLVVNTLTGVQAVDRDAVAMMRSLGASPWQMFWRLTLPSAAPLLAAGVKLALTLALIGAIVGEFVGASEGLGVLLTQFQQALDTPHVYAVIVSLAVMGLTLYGLIAWAERVLIFWTTSSHPR
jgi:NitT/TauT family transport system permease protein